MAMARGLGLPAVEEMPLAEGRSLAGLVDVLAQGRLPRVSELDPYTLGATPSKYGNADTYGQRDEYVPRAKDASLATAFRPGRLVVLAGPSKAGKTRTAFEVLRTHGDWKAALLVAPAPQSLNELVRHPVLTSSDPLVIWLDELQRFLPPTGDLSQAMIGHLLERPGPVVLLGTIRTYQRDLLRGTEGELIREARMVLDSAVLIELASSRRDPNEQARAATVYPEASPRTEGLAEILAGAPELLRRYRDAAITDPLLHTLVQACVDWGRCGLARPIPEPDLLALARAALKESPPDLILGEHEIDEALGQAGKPIATEGQVGLLRTHRLPGRSRAYEAFDYLVAADDGQGDERLRPVTEITWRRVLDGAADEDALGISVAACLRGNIPVAVAASRRAAEAGNAEASYSLGVLLATGLDPPDLAGARTWWTRIADAGHTNAQYGLGVLATRLDPRDPVGAYTWWTRAANAGHTNAQYNLGMLLAYELDPPDLAGARTWWTKAAEAGDTDAQYSLGELLADWLDPPDLAEARAWWTRAAEAGHTEAQYNLGRLLATRLDPPDLAAAQTWYTRAAEAGHTDAQYGLGILLADLLNPPDLAAARIWWICAAEAGDTEAQYNLGILLADLLNPPDLAAARFWWTRAAEAGDTEARYNLGLLAELLNPPDLAPHNETITETPLRSSAAVEQASYKRRMDRGDSAGGA
jgi:TPR repeat protein